MNTHPLLNITLESSSRADSVPIRDTLPTRHQSYNNYHRERQSSRKTQPSSGAFTPIYPSSPSVNAGYIRSTPSTPSALPRGNSNLLDDSLYSNYNNSNNDSVYCDDSISCQNISQLVDTDGEEEEEGCEEEDTEGIDLLLAKVQSALRLETTMIDTKALQNGENEDDGASMLLSAVQNALNTKEQTVYANASANGGWNQSISSNASSNTPRIPSVPKYNEFVLDSLRSPSSSTKQQQQPFSPFQEYRNPQNTPNHEYPMYSSDSGSKSREFTRAASNENHHYHTPVKSAPWQSLEQARLPLSESRKFQQPQITTNAKPPISRSPVHVAPVYHVPKIEYDSFWTKADDDTFIERQVSPVMAKYSK